MPKFTLKDGRNWGVEVDELDKDCNPVHGTDGKVLKIQVGMESAKFSDGSPQSLYWPEGHEHAGVFKGMAAILVERGFADAFKLRAQCKDFKCAWDATGCCCQRILYTQPDFVNVPLTLGKLSASIISIRRRPKKPISNVMCCLHWTQFLSMSCAGL